MPRPPKLSLRSATGSDNHGKPEAPAEGVEVRTKVSDCGEEAGPSTQAEQTELPPIPFKRSRRAARALLRALGHDLRAMSTAASVNARAAASSFTMKIQGLDTPTLSSLVRNLGRSLANPPAKARRAIRRFGKIVGKTRQRAWQNDSRWKSTIRLTAVGCILLAATVLVWALKDVPWSEIRDGTLKPVVVLETAAGGPLVRQGPFQGPYAEFSQFPPHLIDAVLSVEDRRFMDHFGIDVRGIARALIRNFDAGSVVEGGSTITQQLIKLQYLDSNRTIKRKIQEFVISLWLEWKLGKQEILTRYLNSAYLGAGATGMPAAARIYFNKDIGALNLSESALLAGLLRAPSQWNPIDNFEGARQRTSVVLDAMVANGKITAPRAAQLKAGFATLHPTTPTPRSGSWFADWISPKAGEIAGASPGSTTVRTTLDPRLQRIAEKVTRNALDTEGKVVGASQVALVAMTSDGAVVAMVGGRDYKKSQFNRAVTAKRQPGSTFKLFVYYAALKAGLSPSDQVLDAPVDVHGWSPENSSGRYRGWVTLAEAFARSLNAPTVALAQEVGLENVIAAARELGIDAPLSDTPSLALGTSEVSLLDLTSAYASVHLGKAPVEPWGIVEFRAAGQAKAFRVGSHSTPSVDLSAYRPDLLALLQLVVQRGTGREANPGVFAAGKTGTSQNNRDAWFVGFTEPLVAGVWVGNDDDTPMKGVTGGALPAHIWRDFMREAMTSPATGTQEDEATSPHSCNITACSRSYRSFRPSDCSYQPYFGGRRLCEK